MVSMIDHPVRLRSAERYGGKVPPSAVSPVLARIEPLARRSLYMAIEGRSDFRRPPTWLGQACDIRFADVTADGDDTLLILQAPVLGEAAAEVFGQECLPFVDRPAPDSTALDMTNLVLDDLVTGNIDSRRFDPGLLKHIVGFKKAFDRFDEILIEGGGSHGCGPVPLTIQACDTAREWTESAPEPQTIRVTGTMDMMHVSRASFALSLDDDTEVRGILQHGEVQDHKELLGSRVLVTGRLVYRPSGLPLRIEAEGVEPTDDRNPLWSTLPQGQVRRSGAKGLRRLQAAGKGVSGFFGILGDDDDEAAIAAALTALG